MINWICVGLIPFIDEGSVILFLGNESKFALLSIYIRNVTPVTDEFSLDHFLCG